MKTVKINKQKMSKNPKNGVRNSGKSKRKTGKKIPRNRQKIAGIK